MSVRFTLPLLAASFGIASAFVAQGCSSSTPSGFGQEADAGKDVYVPPVIGTSGVDGGIEGVGCGGGEAKTAKSPIYMEFVVDGSGSMDDGKKRPAQEEALRAVFEQIRNDSCATAAYPALCSGSKPADVKDNTQGIGMLYFGPGSTYPGPDDVNIGFVDNAQLGSLLARVNKFPNGSTPTKEALQGGYKVLDNLVPFPPLPATAKKVVVLMSDGEPNDDTGITQMVQAKANQADPITTFSVYVGDLGAFSSTALKFMTDVAVAGGTAPPGCDQSAQNPSNFCHFQITPGAKPVSQVKQDFIDAINTIRGLAGVCEVVISLVDKDGRPADPTKVRVDFVSIDDETKVIKNIPNDPTNGWTYDDETNPTKVIFHGTACEDRKKDRTTKPLVRLGCQGGG